MNNASLLYRHAWVWLLLVAMASALGCASSNEPAIAPPPALAADSLSPVGNQVGDRITPFTLRLSDGSTVTSADLLNENRPTLIFFFKKG